MLLKNVASQGIYLYAIDTTLTPYGPKTGDASNITGYYSLDGGVEGSLTTIHPTEIGHGIYWQPLAQAEINGNTYTFSWVSSTTGIAINPVIGFTSGIGLPNIAFNNNGGLITSGTGTGQLEVTSGKVDDTSGTTTLLSRLTSGRATNLDHLDADISSVSTYGGGDTSGTTTLLSRLTNGRATNLDNLDATISSCLPTSSYTAPNNANIASILSIVTSTLDATISSRSTYNGSDTSGTTTLLSRLTNGRATNLDHLDANISSIATNVNVGTISGQAVNIDGSGNIFAILANDVTHGGNTAFLSLQNLNITNPSGHAITLNSTTDTINIISSAGSGISINANQYGIELTSGIAGIKGTLAPEILASFFTVNSGKIFTDAISGSVVIETAGNTKLLQDGLDAISMSNPTGLAINFREMLIQLYRRFFKQVVKSKGDLTIKTYADDGTTVLTTQGYQDNGVGDETLFEAS